jgi:hypothetical protein
VPKADIAQRYSILLSTVILRRAAGLAQNVGDREVRCVTTSETPVGLPRQTATELRVTGLSYEVWSADLPDIVQPTA